MPAKPKSAFSKPAATLPGEADVLANVIADLSDHDAKLVYADWLEERDDKRGPLLRNFVTAFRAGKKLPAFDWGRRKAAPEPWRNLVGISLMSEIRECDLAEKADFILGLARPALNYKIAKVAEKSLPVGVSKLGGRPDMPADAKWPKYQGGDPLTLIGQFNLADLHASPVCRDLPATGLLSFFYLHDEGLGEEDFTKGTWRVLHFPDASKLVRREFDDELPEEARLSSCRLEFSEALSLPSFESPWRKELKRLSKDDVPYENLCDGFSAGMLGYASPLHGDVLGKKKTARHLLAVGEGFVDWGWLDGDVVYFTIAEDDLKQGRFDRAKMTMECF